MRFELGPASTMFLMGRSNQRNYLIRLWAVLYEPIDERILQAALDRTLVKYPWFFIRFSYVLQTSGTACSQNLRCTFLP